MSKVGFTRAELNDIDGLGDELNEVAFEKIRHNPFKRSPEDVTKDKPIDKKHRIRKDHYSDEPERPNF